MLPKSMMLMLTSPDPHGEGVAPQPPEASVVWARPDRRLRTRRRPAAQPSAGSAEPEASSR
jgi:hypothetical protein